jgi:hypothetical protein
MSAMESGSNPDRPSPPDVGRPASMTDAIIPLIALAILGAGLTIARATADEIEVTP